jgi:hypothetical protein
MSLPEYLKLVVSETETGIYIDSNEGWVVEVVHWPRSPAALKRDDAREFAQKIVSLWNERYPLAEAP